MIENLGQKIDALLKNNGHTRDEIVCVLWGDDHLSIDAETALSIDVSSFWKYADETVWESDEWATGPHYPLWLLSGEEWWLESTEYDCRTNMKFVSKPKGKPARIGITERGSFFELEDNR